MNEPQFKVGQVVRFHPDNNEDLVVTRRIGGINEFPVNQLEPTYVLEHWEGMVKESVLHKQNKKIDIMKKTLAAIAIAAFAFTATAQTNSPTAPLNFFSQATTWATSFNTDADHNWTNNSTIQLGTGIATTTGVGIADRIFVQYNITPRIGVGIMGQFVGIGSAFGALEGTFEYAIVEKYDFKFGVGLSAGYDFNAKDSAGKADGAVLVEPSIWAAKKMTANTYAKIAYVFPVKSVGKFEPAGMVCVELGTMF